MEPKNILLLFPSLAKHYYGPDWKFYETPAPPLGLLYLATPLIKSGHQVRFVDLGVEHLSEKQYFQTLRNADFILITCLSNFLPNIRRIIRDIKWIHPESIIICGGPHCTLTRSHITGSDITVYGEAEFMIAGLIECLVNGGSMDHFQGISYCRNGEIIWNQGENLLEDLDAVDSPALELAQDKNYHYAYGIRLGRTLPVITTRGCPFRCTFCTYQMVKYRERSISKVIQEILSFKKYGAKYLIINDDNFLVKRKRAESFADAIIRNRIKYRIIIQGRVDRVDADLFKKLRKAGLTVLMFGTESANPEVLNFYRKGITLQKIEKTIHLANRFGIITFSGLMIGAPMEQKAHIEANKRFLANVPLDFVGVNILRYEYPSSIWKQAFKEGKIKDEAFSVTANAVLSKYTSEEWAAFRTEILKSFYRQPRRLWRIVRKVILNLGIVTTFKLILHILNHSFFTSAEREFGGFT